jgi:hypothetical protein
VGENDKAVQFSAEKPLQEIGRLVDLPAWAPSTIIFYGLVKEDLIASTVILIPAEPVAVTVNGSSVVLRFKREESAGTDKNMVDLSLPVPVPFYKRPFVIEKSGKGLNEYLPPSCPCSHPYSSAPGLSMTGTPRLSTRYLCWFHKTRMTKAAALR